MLYTSDLYNFVYQLYLNFYKSKKEKENSKRFQKKFSNFSVLQNHLGTRTSTVFTLVDLDGFESF